MRRQPWNGRRRNACQRGAKSKPTTAGKMGRTRGPKPNVTGNRRIARVIESFGADWRERLPDVCAALDKAEVPLVRSQRWIELGCSDWLDVLSEDKNGLVKALEYRINWVVNQEDGSDVSA